MTKLEIKGLLLDFDGVISSLMPRVGWSYLGALKKVKPDIKREIVIESLYTAGEQMLTRDNVNPLYPLLMIRKLSDIKALNFFQKIKFMVTGGIMYFKGKDNIIPQPGVNDVLYELSKNYKLGIVTTAERRIIEKAKTIIPALEKFSVIVTREDCKNTKPHPEGILKALRNLNLKADQCLYVGDLPTDVVAGRRANIRVVGILGEFKDIAKGRIMSYKPNYIIPLLKDLPSLLNQINTI
ncbi:MAG: HAD-IA family hydrolase [Asgard group archaeon]|nr:HAD-IA family hydrolase [Asgard group archaeon]